MSRLTRCLTAAVVTLAAAAPAPAQGLIERSSGKITAPFKPVVKTAADSTVRVRCDDRDSALGVVAYGNGYVLTKASELRGKVSVRLNDGSEYDATVVGIHKPTDLALLAIDATGLTPISFSDSRKAPVGNWLAAAGPNSDPVGVGIVSVATRKLAGADASLYENKNKGYLGVMLEDDDALTGAKVTQVLTGGAAAKAGLKKDDVICELAGTGIKGHGLLREMLENYRPGDTITVRVKRGDEDLKLKVTLDNNKNLSRGEMQNRLGGDLSGRRTGFPEILQTDMVLEPKNCGAPIVDLDGKVLGLAIARAGRVETWVLPSEVIRPLLKDLKEGKLSPVSMR